MSTCEQLDLETVGYQPIVPKNLPLKTLFLIDVVDSSMRVLFGRFLGIIGQSPSVSKSDRFHIVIIWFFFANSGYIP